MLEFSDTPYDYFPPKLNRAVLALLRQYNRFINLPGRGHRIRDYTVLNPESLAAAQAGAGRRIVFLPNHSTHSDPEIMVELQRRYCMTSLFMTAYDVFQRSAITAWAIQRAGAFSVDRDANDSRSMKQAIQTMVDGRHALTIFPEGNVYFTNDQVTPFLDGAAFMALKAQKELGHTTPIAVVPVAIKLTHCHDQRHHVRSLMAAIGREVGCQCSERDDVVTQLRTVGMTVLGTRLREHNYAIPESESDLAVSLTAAASAIIERLETDMGVTPRATDSAVDRVRMLRRRIHELRTDNDRLSAVNTDAERWAAEALLAFRILSYSGDYVQRRPTLDRVSETVEKLREDHQSVMHPPFADRHVYVSFGRPTLLTDHLDAFTKKARHAVSELTSRVEADVQRELDSINSQNPHPGGQLF